MAFYFAGTGNSLYIAKQKEWYRKAEKGYNNLLFLSDLLINSAIPGKII